MIWQDWALSIIQWLFVLALMPAVFGLQKPDKWTCMFTGILLYSTAAIFFTLNLWGSAISSGVVASTWMVLFVQNIRRD